MRRGSLGDVMHKFLASVGAGASLLFLSNVALADGYGAPSGYERSFSWTGFYIGVNGGYGWSETTNKFAEPAFGILPKGINPQGAFGGGQIGYNWQGILHRNLVLGVEADIQGSEIKDFDPGKFVGQGGRSNLHYFGTVRGRLGYAFGSTLLYATGGFAYGGIRNDVYESALLFGPPIQQVITPFDKNAMATGYTVGGGWEYKISQAWSLKAEYQFIDLGRNDPIGVPFGGAVSQNACSSAVFIPTIKCADDAYHTVRAGLNYQFGSTYAPLK